MIAWESSAGELGAQGVDLVGFGSEMLQACQPMVDCSGQIVGLKCEESQRVDLAKFGSFGVMLQGPHHGVSLGYQERIC